MPDQPLTNAKPKDRDQPLTDVTDDPIPDGDDELATGERVDEDVPVEDPDGDTEDDEDLEAPAG